MERQVLCSVKDNMISTIICLIFIKNIFGAAKIVCYKQSNIFKKYIIIINEILNKKYINLIQNYEGKYLCIN